MNVSRPWAKHYSLIWWILSGSIILSCLGYLISTLRYSDKVFTVVWSEHYLDLTEDLATRVSEWGAICMLVAAVLGSFYRLRGFQVLVFFWFLTTVISSYVVEIWHPGYGLGAAAVRMTSPLLLLFVPAPDSELSPIGVRMRSFEWGIRLAVAFTFFYHGHECLAGRAQFLDYLQGFVRLFGFDGMSSVSALAVLKLIGVLDVMVAIAILIPVRLYLIAGWMVIWGLATGFARISFAGWGNYPEFFLRIVHGTLPLCLIILWHAQKSAFVLRNNSRKNLL